MDPAGDWVEVSDLRTILIWLTQIPCDAHGAGSPNTQLADVYRTWNGLDSEAATAYLKKKGVTVK